MVFLAAGTLIGSRGLRALSIFATALVRILAGTVGIAAAFCRSSRSFVLTAGMQLVVRFIGSFYLFGIVSGSSNALLDLSGIGRRRIILYGQLFSVYIPQGISSPGTLGRFLNLAFAHTALAGNLDLFSLFLGKASLSQNNKQGR